MPIKQRPPRKLDLGLGLLAFCLIVVIGGAGALWSLHQLGVSSERAARQDAKAMAQSVAQTLALQISRAVLVGIPLEEIPGVPAYLQRMLQKAPSLAYIALQRPDGTTLHSTPMLAVGEQVRASIQVQDKTAGTVLIGTHPAALAHASVLTQALCGLTLLGIGLAGGWLAARGPGASLEIQRTQLEASLREGQPPPPTQGAASDSLQRALQALELGTQQVQEQQAAVSAFAQELLAVDFDQRMQNPVTHILQNMASPCASAPDGDA